MKLRRKTVNLFRHLMLVGILFVTAYLVLNFPTNPVTIFSSQIFIQVILMYIFLFLGYQFFSNKLKYKIEIIDRTKLPRPISPITKDKKLKLFVLASQILSIPFLLLIIREIFVAHASGTGTVISYWNFFGELGIETILFLVIAVIVVTGIVLNFQILKQEKFS